MSPSDSDQASELLLLRAVESLQSGAPIDIAVLRGPLAELLDDHASGDDESVVSPYAEAVAQPG
ncbi:hypothetical protein [Streptomyces sp. NPDC086182]|uniref:hypothetical protein n=1 Tax=Streptomyces sp. NPDC086182 TaxID=3155058 RepID=UPI0034388036